MDLPVLGGGETYSPLQLREYWALKEGLNKEIVLMDKHF